MMKKTFFFLFLFINILAYSQLTVNNSLTPQQLVQNILAGTGVQISNVSYSGAAISIGSFDGTSSNIGFPGGLILSTGNIADAVGPNNSGSSGEDNNQPGDLDLDVITSNDTYDAAVLEFDFVPVSDTIKFNYVFGSEEYMEFVNGGVNDGFGFFISGPGINGPFANNAENLALIPGTSQFVTIDNVNEDLNGQFYFNNENPAGQSVQYDGFTLPLQAISQVQCGQTYHLKIVIADAGDGVWDSGVFLEAGSLSSTDVDFIFASVDGLTDFYENCTEAEFIFTRPSDQIATELTINIAFSGTATAGVDYSTIPNSIVFAIGVDTVLVPFSTFTDNLIEPSETVTITADVITECGDTVQIIKSITINDPIRIDSLNALPSLICANTGSANSFISNEVGTINYAWSGPGSGGPNIGANANISNVASGWYYLTVDDDFCESSDSIFIDNIALPIADFSIGSTIGATPLSIVFTNQSQNADTYEWTFGNGLDSTVTSMGTISSVYPNQTTYTVILVAFNSLCSDTIIKTFEILTQPSVHEINIFTPNENDSINAGFTLDPKNFTSFEFIVVNRWGNLMFEGNLQNPWWNGKTTSNKDAEEGTYFYKYSGIGLNGDPLSGHGFVQIKR
jgi:PKD repeat protein